MNHRFKNFVLLLCCTPFISQCVPTGQDITNLDLRIRNMNSQMLQVDKKIGRIEEKTDKLTRNNPIEMLLKKQAAMSDTLDRLNLEFLQIKGQLDESSHYYQNAKEESAGFQTTTESRLDSLAEQMALLADQMNQTSAKLASAQENSKAAAAEAQAAREKAQEAEKRAAERIALAEKRAEKAEAEAIAAEKKAHKKPEIAPNQTKIKYENGKKQSPPPPKTQIKPKSQAKPEKTSGPGKEIYDQALGLFRAGKYNDAYRAFTSYIEQNPQGKMVPNARFWLGDCYYNQQEYELSILEYQKVLADFPKDLKAPAALLKQGLAFEKLKDKDTAKIVYNKLLAEYPKSEQASAAKNRINALK